MTLCKSKAPRRAGVVPEGCHTGGLLATSMGKVQSSWERNLGYVGCPQRHEGLTDEGDKSCSTRISALIHVLET